MAIGCHYRFRDKRGSKKTPCCYNDGGGHKIQVFPKKPLMVVPFVVDEREILKQRGEKETEVYNKRDMNTADFV